LNADFVALTKLPDIRARMAELGAEPIGSTAAQLGEIIRSDIAKYRKIVKDAKISIN
jgi:tripartite-type tricarboxylate transporter receptor subunit TctC